MVCPEPVVCPAPVECPACEKCEETSCGCMNSNASNYNSEATINASNCEFGEDVLIESAEIRGVWKPDDQVMSDDGVVTLAFDIVS